MVMVRKPIGITLLILGFFAILGYMYYLTWKQETLAPLQTTVTKVLATKTGHSYATATQSAEYAQMTATVQQAIRYEEQTQTQVSWVITATAIPTPTPTQAQFCQAHVVKEDTFLYSDPGINPNPEARVRLPFKKDIQIIGRMEDTEWLFIDFDGIMGFTQGFNLERKTSDCEPQFLDIHYMANYLVDPDWRLVLEDSFATNTYLWYAMDGTQVVNDASEPESMLEVSSYGARQEFSTEKITTRKFGAFEVILNAKVVRANTTGFFGVKFFITEDGYNEIRFNPYTCVYSVFEGDTELFSGNVDQSLCRLDTVFQVRIKVDAYKRLLITINGETQGPTEIINVTNKEMSGPMSLIVNDLQVFYNYLVVTSPKE